MKTIQPHYQLVLWGLLIISGRSYGQSTLDNYVREGLQNNRVITEKNLSLAEAQKALQIARTYFMPTVTLSADYTNGQGGRSIALPLGKLLNPVYRTLNQLTGSDGFPRVADVEESFFPKNFYDAKVRATIPLVNTDLYINQQLRKEEVSLKKQELDIFKRQLVFEIKSAYLLYLSAVTSLKIHESAFKVVHKSVEVHESLLRNGRGLKTTVLRMKAEVEKVKADITNAKYEVVNSRNYFNFLINRDLNSEIVEDPTFIEDFPDAVGVNIASTREELHMLQTIKRINESSRQLQQLNRLPKIHAFLDLGSQASDWKYNSDSRYYLVGVQLTIPLFHGLRNNLLIQQRQLEVQKAQSALENKEDQIELSLSIAINEVNAKRKNYAAAREQLNAAEAYYHLINKGFQEGVNSLVEFLDARNQITAGELQLNITSFDILIALAKVERENASYPITQSNPKAYEK